MTSRLDKAIAELKSLIKNCNEEKKTDTLKKLSVYSWSLFCLCANYEDLDAYLKIVAFNARKYSEMGDKARVQAFQIILDKIGAGAVIDD